MTKPVKTNENGQSKSFRFERQVTTEREFAPTVHFAPAEKVRVWQKSLVKLFRIGFERF